MTTVLLLDPESSGADLLVELQKRGATVTTWWQDIPFVLTAVDDTATPAADLIRFVDANEFDHIVAGSESAVSAAEWLAARRGLKSSNPDYIYHRRDKNAMIGRVGAAGIPTASSHLVTNVDQVASLRSVMTLPVMIKPSSSAGSDLCRAVNTWADAASFTEEVLASRSTMGNKNAGAVIQEFIVGPQFHVNTVVVDGRHHVTEVYSNHFRDVDGSPQLYAGRTYTPDEPGIEAVTKYAIACAEALGASTGATHIEVRLTSGGPRLIEFNGRLMGPTQPFDYFSDAQGFSQASIFADVLTGNTTAALHALSQSERSVLGFYMLTAARSGTLSQFDDTALRGLPSYKGVFKQPTLGTSILLDNRTTDADLGLVFFAHPDRAQVETDLLATASLERQGSIHSVVPTELAEEYLIVR